MDFLTNVYVALPVFWFWLALIFIFLKFHLKFFPPAEGQKIHQYVNKNINMWLVTSVVACVIMLMASEIIKPRNRVQTFNEVSPISAEVVAGDAEKASQPFVDRVPKPKQREVFVHEMKKDKNAE